MRAPLLLLCLLTCLPCALPCSAAAQCVLSGQVAIDAVTPRGTTLSFGLAEEARVTLEGTSARVEGLRPIAFVGRAASRDVTLFAGAARRVGGVLSIAAGTALRVNRVRGGQAASHIDAGAVRVALSLPCAELALAPPATSSTETAEDDDDLGSALLVRGRRLEVFSGPTSARGVRLALRAGSPVSEWPWLTPHGASGTRIHVRGVLDDGVSLDGWVERDDVYRPTSFTAMSCCDAGTMGGCGHGYAGQSFRGMAQITAGAELTDVEGHVWGRVVEATEAMVVVSTITSTGHAPGAEPTVTRTDTVWIEGIAGLVPDPCSSFGVQVDRTSVVLPTDPS